MSSRYRRIIDAYREALRLRDPEMCRVVDGQMEAWGEGWVCRVDEPPDLDRWMTAKEIAGEFGITEHWLYDWSRRGKIQKTKQGGRVLFLLREALQYYASKSA